MRPAQAEMLAEETIKRLGFVVVKYASGQDPTIGTITAYLWKVFKMPQPFVVIREATEGEWRLQVSIFRELVGTREAADKPGTPYALVTD